MRLNYNLSILEEAEAMLVLHGLTLQCCASICLVGRFIDSFWGQVQLKDLATSDAEPLCK